MLRLICILAAILVASPVFSAEVPTRGAAPAWVEVIARPDSETDASDGGPVRILLLDQQTRFAPDGVHIYVRQRYQIQTIQGLAVAGTVAIAWNPASQSISLHHLNILRGDRVIDVLDQQQFDVLRRERNLDSAILDGVLTATLQPNGLQVGDIIDLAYTATTRDSVLGDHAEHVAGGLTLGSIDRMRVRASWPGGKTMRIRATEPWQTPKIVRDRDGGHVEIDARDIHPLPIPEDAPARFAQAQQLELTDYASWRDVSALMAPLYARAAVLEPGSPVLAEAERIRAAYATPLERASAALRLVQNDIRYLALAMGEGGLTPASADDTWRNRFGDCKGKTALLLALLKALDIDAQAAAVSMSLGDGLDQRLPMVALLDHVLVRTQLDGRTYWIDGARMGDTTLEAAPIPNHHWALPISAPGQDLVALTPPPSTVPLSETEIRLDASAGLDAPARVEAEALYRGDLATTMNIGMQTLAPQDRDRIMRDVWKAQLTEMTIETVASAYDPERNEYRLTVTGAMPLNWTADTGGSARKLDLPGGRVGFAFGDGRDTGPYRDLPVALPYPAYFLTRTVLTPPGAGFRPESADVDLTVAGFELKRRTSAKDGKIVMEWSTRTLAAEISADAIRAAPDQVKGIDRDRPRVRAPISYRATEADLKAMAASEPTTAQDYLNRGLKRNEAGDGVGALADMDRAIALDPQNASAFANRGIIRFWRQDIPNARADFEKAADLDPADWVAMNGQGLIALSEGRAQDAVIEFSRSLRQQKNNTFILIMRGRAYAALGQIDKAVADLDAALALSPDAGDLRRAKYETLAGAGRDEEALIEIDRLIADAPEDADLPIMRAMLKRRIDSDDAAAIVAVDAALAHAPSGLGHIARAQLRAEGDLAGRLSDYNQALALDPADLTAWQLRIGLEREHPELGDAAATVEEALAKVDEDDADDLRLRRAELRFKAGDAAGGRADLQKARSRAVGNAQRLNNLCWTQAVAGVDLQQALADCDAALALKADEPAFLDSRGLVLLHLDRPAEALSVYEAALGKAPRLAASLYGRGMARLALGDTTKAAEDLSAAEAIAPKVKESFAAYRQARNLP